MEENFIISIFAIILGLTLISYGITKFNIEKMNWESIIADISKINIIETEKLSKYAKIYFSYQSNNIKYYNHIELKEIQNLDQLIDSYRKEKKINIFCNKQNPNETILEIPYEGINFVILGLVFCMIGVGFYFNQPIDKPLTPISNKIS